MRYLLISVLLLGSALTAWSPADAATINALSCSRTDVGNAVGTAKAGDIVNMPPGDCAWSSHLAVNVGITLKGAGEGITTIRDNVPKNGGVASRLMTFTVDAPSTFRITGFTLVGQTADTSVYNQGHIGISGTSKAFRVDHITVMTPQTVVIRTFGYLWGVIDHITVNGNRPLLQASHEGWGGVGYGDGSWAEALYLGTEKAIYVEDCILTATNNPYVTNFTDGLDGARVVIRHNKFVQGNTGSHGVDSGQRRRSIRSQEIYNNTFSFPVGMPADFIAWFRGGTGVMFNNTIVVPAGVNSVAKHSNLRDTKAYTPWGQCNGTSPYDQNQAGKTGYLCVDQPGAGTSRNLGGVATLSAQPVGNTPDPIYVWNNTVNGSPNNCGTFGCGDSGHVVAGRDIIFGSARPGYAAFVYPHPLVSGQALPAPTGLQVK